MQAHRRLLQSRKPQLSKGRKVEKLCWITGESQTRARKLEVKVLLVTPAAIF